MNLQSEITGPSVKPLGAEQRALGRIVQIRTATVRERGENVSRFARAKKQYFRKSGFLFDSFECKNGPIVHLKIDSNPPRRSLTVAVRIRPAKRSAKRS